MINYIFKMPQYEVKNSDVYFLGKKIKKLSEESAKMYSELPIGVCDVRNVSQDVIAELIREHIVIEWEPLKKIKSKDSSIVVISPHIDDAIFSIGGILQRLSTKHNVYVVSLFSIDPYSIYKELQCNFWQLQKIKRLEEYCITDLIHATTIQMCWPDALLRKYDDIYTDVKQEEPILEYTKILLEVFPENIKTVMCPVGIAHIDHKLTRIIIENIKAMNLFDCEFVYYNELPYAIDNKMHNPCGLHQRKIKLTTKELIRKKKMIKVYVSQLNPGLANRIVGYKGGCEILWCSA